MNPYQSLATSNPGNGSAAEYEFIGELIKQYAPANVLIFSVGKDSSLWYSLNQGEIPYSWKTSGSGSGLAVK